MASKKDNLKALLTNTRTRVIIIFTAVVLVLAVGVGVVRFTASTGGSSGDGQTSISAGAANIKSVPGSSDPTAQYAALQAQQNVDQAKQAAKTGGSSIPTIIRTQAFGDGIQSVGAKQGKGGVGFSTLARDDYVGPQKDEWINALKNSNCSKSAMDKAKDEGATLSVIKEACTCVQLKDNGYDLNALQQVCTCKSLKAAGYDAKQLKDEGFSASRLRACGFNACELRDAGFTAQQLKDAGFTDGELKGAGYSNNEIAKASGLPNGITAADIRKAGCGVDALRKLRSAGVTASAIKRISGCSAAQMKAAGYTAKDLKNAGFSAAELKNAGFSPEDLKKAGYSARDLLNAGFTPDELAKAGYKPSEIEQAEGQLPPGVTPQDVKEAGCNIEALKREMKAGISAKEIRKDAGCSAAALKAAGFSDADLARAGFTPNQIKAATFGDKAAISGDGSKVSNNAIEAAGCDPKKLRALRLQGVSAKRIRDISGCSAKALKAAGFDASELKNAGFTPRQLLDAGFTPDEVNKASGISDQAIRDAGCDPTKLKSLFNKGVSAARIKSLNGCSAKALKEAGFSVKDLANAGFTPKQLLAAGFSPAELTQAGLTPTAAIARGRTADCSVESLTAAREMGASATTIKQTLGCSAKAMKAAGYTAAQLKKAGYSAAELKDAGFTAAELKNAWFTAKELKDAGFSAKDLKDAGFSAAQLKDAGFSAGDLKKAGFSASQLRNAGFSAKQLKKAGFTAGQLKNAGFSPSQIKNAGYTNQELNTAGLAGVGSDTDGLSSGVPGLDAAPTPGSLSSDIDQIPGAGDGNINQQAQKSQQQLQNVLNQQQRQMADQQFQQKIQNRQSLMLGAANESLQSWKAVSTQVFVAGSKTDKSATIKRAEGVAQGESGLTTNSTSAPHKKALIKTGEVMFAVLDTSINSDEPSPILATIVSVKLKGTKLIGSFTLPSNADKMVINFNTMSVPGAPHTTGISAYAIDPNTARTALSSYTNHHYLQRYGSLFAATFLEGFGNAFQSANTTIQIGGTGGAQTTTVSNGVGRSVLENAVIGLATLGKQWGQIAQQQFNRPTTVSVCAGTGVGILFTQDVMSI
jgi:intracellular multiplication protein IcmE